MIALLAIGWMLGALTVWALVLVGARSERMPGAFPFDEGRRTVEEMAEDTREANAWLDSVDESRRIHRTSGRLLKATPIHRSKS